MGHKIFSLFDKMSKINETCKNCENRSIRRSITFTLHRTYSIYDVKVDTSSNLQVICQLDHLLNEDIWPWQCPLNTIKIGNDTFLIPPPPTCSAYIGVMQTWRLPYIVTKIRHSFIKANSNIRRPKKWHEKSRFEWRKGTRKCSSRQEFATCQHFGFLAPLTRDWQNHRSVS